jgi:hypothetical protein
VRRAWAAILAGVLLAAPARGAVEFDGNDIYSNTSAGIVTAPPFTIAMWIYPTNLDGTNRGPLTVSDNAGPGTRYWTLQANTTSVRWFAGDGGGNSSANTSAAPTANVWQHWCAVEAATNSRACYLNGANKGTNSTTRTPTAGTWSTFVGSAAFSHACRIHWLVTWNVALTDSEVASLAAGQHPLTMRPSAITHAYPLREHLAAGAQDVVGGVSLATIASDPATVEGPAVMRNGGPTYGLRRAPLWRRREDDYQGQDMATVAASAPAVPVPTRIT